MDLTEAEGLIDLINAQTEQQRKQSLYQMQGALKELYERWRIELVRVNFLLFSSTNLFKLISISL